jgi:flagellar basal-body rod protein FlgF
LLKKSPDGQIRNLDGGVPPVDQQASVVQGFVELANVNVVEELVNSIENQRHYEINIKMIVTAKDMDESSTSLLSLPS